MSQPRRHMSVYRLLLIASNYGKTSHPAWYRNLVANPKVEVLAGKHTGTYAASEITDPAERERAWDLALNQYAGYADYEGRSGDRTIPLVRLERASG
jgi:deazaflavin-dependent oxidoreductase (nitroreductase family)